MATEVDNFHGTTAESLYNLLFSLAEPPLQIDNPLRKEILKQAGAKSALDKLVKLGADREIVMLCLEELAFQCEVEKLDRVSSRTKPKERRCFYLRSEFIALLRKVAEKIELANNLSRRPRPIAMQEDPVLVYYERLPSLLRSYGDHLKETKRRAFKGGNIRPTTRPKVFLIEKVRTSTREKPCFAEIATLVSATYYASGLLKERGFCARTLEQAWKRNPALRDSLFPARFHGIARPPSPR